MARSVAMQSVCRTRCIPQPSGKQNNLVMFSLSRVQHASYFEQHCAVENYTWNRITDGTLAIPCSLKKNDAYLRVSKSKRLARVEMSWGSYLRPCLYRKTLN